MNVVIAGQQVVETSLPTKRSALRACAVLALAYFGFSALGMILAVPPGYATAVWPASGIAVASLLIWGAHLWPGIVLGSMAVNLIFSSANLTQMTAWLVPFGIGLGAGLQAMLGRALIQRYCPYPSGYEQAKEVCLLLLLAGPLACLLNATSGSLILFSSSALSSSEIAFTWWTWWVGDAVGVLVFLPLMLICFGEPKAAWRIRSFSVGLPLFVSFCVAVAVFTFANRAEQLRVENAFKRESQDIATQLGRRVDEAQRATLQAASFMANVPDMSFGDFLHYSNPVLQELPHVAAMEWVPRVPVDQVSAFEEQIRIRDFPEFQINQRDERGHRVAVKGRSDYYPVTYMAPIQGNEGVLGFDLASESVRRAVLAEAARSGQVAVSGVVELVQGGENHQAVLMAAPIYRSNVMNELDTSMREKGIAGFSVLVLRISDLLHGSWMQGHQGAWLHNHEHLLSLRLQDLAAPTNQNALFEHSIRRDIDHSLKQSFDLPVGLHNWRLSVNAGAAFQAQHRSVVVWTTLASVLVMSSLLGAFLLVFSGRMFRIESAVTDRTAELSAEVEERRRAENALRRSEEQYRRLAFQDPLTGLANREYFSRRLVEAVASARQNKQQLAVHFFDLDHFKDVNDALGHPIGDALLKRIAHNLRKVLRRNDLLARLGGDEFAILQVDVRQAQQAEDLALRTIEAVSKPLMIEGFEVRTSTSVGISLMSEQAELSRLSHQELAVRLMEEADIALYAVKERQRGRFAFHESLMSERVHHVVNVGNALKRAMAENSDELFLVFQPQVRISDGLITGFEALLRWHSQELGVVDPAEFVNVAEARGLILDLGKFTLRGACHMLGQIHADDSVAEDFKLGVNVSVSQFTDAGFVDDVQQTLAEFSVDPSRLELEITEGVLARSIDQVEGKIRQLRELGVSISIDDFGTGYSSLLYLKRMPVNRIKVAQEFVRDMLVDNADAEIVKATIQIANALDLDLIAEGVETQAHADYLASLGCTAAQGYFFHRPMNEAELMGKWPPVVVKAVA